MTSSSARLLGSIIALAIGMATVFGAFAIAGDEAFGPSELAEEWWILLLNVVWVAGPFLVLSLAGIGRRKPWLVALAATLALWGAFAFSARYSPGDANLGMGLLMLLAPFAINGVALLVDRRKNEA